MRHLLAFLTLSVALAAPLADAAEKIRSFDVVVHVQEDGSLEVTETIRVTAEGRNIKRGIYRDFPVEHREKDGRVSLTTFKVTGVRRNGAKEPYTRTRRSAYVRTRIGDKDVFLPTPSEQVYELSYRTEGQLRGYSGYDELYWNVTGNEWNFPILAASVEIRLPQAALIRQYAGYTGPTGATGGAYEVLEAKSGVFRARITEPLGRREGFTVAVAWPPGVVTVPPMQYGVRGFSGFVAPPMYLGGQRLGPVAAVGGTLAGALALLLAWLRVGRDPQGGAVYPQFDPPSGLSPAAIRYVQRMGFDPRCLTAAILSMAVKGAVRIAETPSSSFFRNVDYTLEPLGLKPSLSPGERAAFNALFSSGRELTLRADEKNGKRMDKGRNELKSLLWDEHYGASFRRNTGYTIGGILIGAVIGVLLIGVTERWNMFSILQWAIPAVAATLLAYAAGLAARMIGDFRQGGSVFNRRRLSPVLTIAIFALVSAGQISAFLTVGGLPTGLEPGLILAGAAFGIAAALFHFLMAAPSKAGRKLLDQIEGFELYMRTAEEDRLDLLNPPEKTPELFERLLPHAVALGLSHQWSEKFAGVLAAAGMPQPNWYSGEGRLDIDRFDRDFGQAVSSTSEPSRGGSGSGGGGSSGGGGGGGGGGGW